jgi:hypothetical protein
MILQVEILFFILNNLSPGSKHIDTDGTRTWGHLRSLHGFCSLLAARTVRVTS